MGSILKSTTMSIPPKQVKLLVKEDVQKKNIPPDGGWGWVVCGASFVILSFLASQASVFGLIFSQLFKNNLTSSTLISWIFNVQSFVFNVTCLVAGPMCDIFGWRKTATIGGFLCSIAFISSGFAESPYLLFITFSLGGGIGGGLGLTAAYICPPAYFDKHRGKAMAIVTAGICVGQFCNPPLVTFLIEKMGFKGACLIYGGLILNACVASQLLHPLSWHSKELVVKCDKESQIDYNNKDFNFRKRIRNDSVQSSNSMNELARNVFISHTSLAPIPADCESNSKKAIQQNENNKFIFVIKTVIKYLKIFRYRRACIITFADAFVLAGYINFIMMVPFVVQDQGYSLSESAWVVSVGAICSMTVRLIINPISDMEGFNKTYFYMAGSLVAGICTAIFPFVSNYYLFLVTMGIWGVGIGINMALFSLVIIEYMGIDLFPHVFGAAGCVIAFMLISSGPMVGFIRDVTESYKFALLILGGLQIMHFIMWLFMPLCVKYDQNKEKS